ncbi:MAG: carotenoid biosynthesis protein [Bacteroidota bacterium]|jgi:putative membrane protein
MMREKMIQSGYYVLPLLYAVGVLGMLLYKSFFIHCTPFLLLICFAWIMLAEKEQGADRTRMILLAVSAGYAIELVGVGTGKIFGIYWYGESLGPKISGVPPLIGINWCMLLLGASSLVTYALQEKSILLKSFLTAGLMTMLDFCMEPVCDVLDMWYWGAGEAGLRNFMVWYAFSMLLSLIYFAIGFRRINVIAMLVFGLQFVFFSVLWALHAANIFL